MLKPLVGLCDCPRSVLAMRVSVFGAMYVLCAEAGHFLSFPEGFATFWPPSGLFLGVLLLSSLRDWPWFVAAAFLGNFVSDLLFPHTPARSLGVVTAFTTGNILEAVVGAWLLRRFVASPFQLVNVAQVLGLIVIAGSLATTLSATIGATAVMYGFGTVPYWTVWLKWWVGDAMGILTLTPLVITWLTKPERRQSFSLVRVLEATTLFGGLIAFGYFALYVESSSPRIFFVFPLLIWAGMRFGRRGAATAVALVAVMAVWSASRMVGPFAGSRDLVDVATNLHAFLGTTMLTSLLFATALAERAQADAERQESLNLFKAVLQGTTDAVFAKNRQGQYLMINEAGARLLGLHPDEIIGRDDTTLFSPDTAAAIMQADQRVMQEGRFKTYEEQGTAAGVTRTYLSTKGPYLGNAGELLGLVGISRDVTEYRRALVSSEAEERRFSTLTSFAPVGIFESDAAGNVTYVNPRWCEITGLTPEMANAWGTALHPDDRERIVAIWIDTVTRQQNYVRDEFRFVTPQGKATWVVVTAVVMRGAQGDVVGYMGSVVDITDRVQMEDELRRSQELFEQMANSIPEVFFLRDVEPFRFLYISPAYEKITGRKATELLASPFSFLETVHPDDQEKMRQLSLTKIVTTVEDSFKAYMADGTLRYMRIRVSPVKDGQGNVERLAGIVFDVTELTLFEQALESSNRELEQRVHERTAELISANEKLRAEYSERARVEDRVHQQQLELAHVARLSTIGQMAAELAHELNQPLYAIQNYLFGILQSTKLGEPVTDDLLTALKNAETESGRATNIIRRVRNFTRRSEPQRVPFSINNLVRDVFRLTSTDARHRRIEMNVKLDEKLPVVLGDPVQIEQVTVNLVRNAFDAIQESGGESSLVVLETSLRGDDVVLSVHDNGPGIPPDLHEKVFEPFFTTKHDGLGLGLAISRSIIEAHQGRMWAESRRPRGTTFHFSLPVAQD